MSGAQAITASCLCSTMRIVTEKTSDMTGAEVFAKYGGGN